VNDVKTQRIFFRARFQLSLVMSERLVLLGVQLRCAGPIPSEQIHVRALSEGEDLAEEDGGTAKGGHLKSQGGANIFVDASRNRNVRFNEVGMTNALKVANLSNSSSSNRMHAVFNVLLAFAYNADKPTSHRLYRFFLCAGEGRIQAASQENNSIEKSASGRNSLSAQNGKKKNGLSNVKILGECFCEITNLLSNVTLSLPLGWSQEIVYEYQSQKQGRPPEASMIITQVKDPVWQRLCDSTLTAYAGFLLHHPLARSFLLSPSLALEDKKQRGIILSEISFETSLSYLIPALFLRLRLTELVQRITRWEHLYEHVRLANCAFESEAAANSKGYRRIKIEIVGASDLAQVQHGSQSADDRKSRSKSFAGAFNSFVQGAQRAAGKSETSYYQENGISRKLSNPFVRVSFRHPAGHQVRIGRTFPTGQRTASPRFTACVAENDFVRLESETCFGFYAPASPDLEFTFEILHERNHALSQKTTHVPMMRTVLPLRELLKAQQVTNGLGLPFTELDLYSFEREHKGHATLGKLHLNIDARAAFDDLVFPVIPEHELYYRFSVRWMDKFLRTMSDDMIFLQSLLKSAESHLELIDAEFEGAHFTASCMKRSIYKKEKELGAVATNLHASFVVLETEMKNSAVIAREEENLGQRSSKAKKSAPKRPPRPLAPGADHLRTSQRSASVGNASQLHGQPPSSRRPAPSRRRSDHPAGAPPPRPARRSGMQNISSSGGHAGSGDNVPALFGIFPLVTCGAPAAHCLGLSSSKTLMFERLRLRVLCNVCKEQKWNPVWPGALPTFGHGGDPSADLLESWQQYAECAERTFIRESVVVSQALSTAVACFISELAVRLSGSDIAVHHVSQWMATNRGSTLPWMKQLYDLGFLIGWESLVSAQGKELSMLEDSIAALEALEKMVKIHIVSYDEMPLHGFHNAAQILFGDEAHQIHVHLEDGKDENCILVYVALPNVVHDRLLAPIETQKRQAGISMIPVLFTQGINETQTLANFSSTFSDTIGSTRQTDLNHASLERVEVYMERYRAWLHLQDGALSPRRRELASVDQAAQRLQDAVKSQQRSQKDVQILITAENAVRALNGGRVTFCKSGKDRTAMSITLEETTLLRNMPVATVLPELRSVSAFVDVVSFSNTLREFGSRIALAEKNVGRPKYSFNPAQRQLLPAMYRPPVSTIQDFLTSMTARDS